uniref:Uncharacterized protein n=1 Tax=Strongyloides papillosus TaxID=174720 RepID=A0A0N5BLE8_STREA
MSSYITPLNLSGNAFAERHIECLQHTLTKEMLSQSGKGWDNLVGLIVYYYTISSKQNQPSPYELHFSRLPVSPLSLRLKASPFINNKEKEMTNLSSTKTAYSKKKSTRKLKPKYSDPCQLQSISNDKKTALLITYDGRKLRRFTRNLKVKG